VTWFLAVLIVLAIGGVAVVAAGRGDSLGPAYDDRPDVRLPADRPVTGDDLRALRFNTTLRGYRASEVDALIDLLAAQLDDSGDDGGDDLMDDRGGPAPDTPQ
jgi:DivIVA domain-containing protein